MSYVDVPIRKIEGGGVISKRVYVPDYLPNGKGTLEDLERWREEMTEDETMRKYAEAHGCVELRMPKLTGFSSVTERTPSLKVLFSPSRAGKTEYDFTSSQKAMSTLTGPPSNANSQKRRFTSPPRVRDARIDFSQWL